MEKRPAWSYSALNDFVNCPRQYHLKKTKALPFVETAELREGKVSHKALEERLLTGKELPANLVKMEAFVQRIESAPGEKLVEMKRTIDADFKPVTWFSKDAWVRSIMDVGIAKSTEVWIGDYKTGKRREGSDQLMLAAALEMHHSPDIERVRTSFIWLKENKLDSETYVRDQLPAIWQHFMPKVARLEAAFEKDVWPAKPSGLCGWCDATRAQCEFSKKGSK